MCFIISYYIHFTLLREKQEVRVEKDYQDPEARKDLPVKEVYPDHLVKPVEL